MKLYKFDGVQEQDYQNKFPKIPKSCSCIYFTDSRHSVGSRLDQIKKDYLDACRTIIYVLSIDFLVTVYLKNVFLSISRAVFKFTFGKQHEETGVRHGNRC